MTILPLVERELRVAVRKPYAYRIRTGAGAGAMVIAVWGLWVWSSWIAGAFVGHALFRTVASIAFVGCLSAGLLLTADSISQERREGTLGLLFLTDLRPADVVLGKFAAKVVLPGYALLATLPALAVFTVVGGVTGGELWRTMLVLANTLFVSLSVALFTSVLCVEQRIAHGLAFLAIAVLAGGSMVLGGLTATASVTTLKWLIAAFNLTTTFTFADGRNFQAAPAIFVISLLATHCLAWLSLILACRLLPPARRELRFEPKRLSLVHGKENCDLDAAASIARAQLLEVNPMAWLGTRFRRRARAVWILPTIAALSWCGLNLITTGRAHTAATLFWAGLIHIALRLWIALDASHTFAASRQNGTLESLLGTPMSPREIAEGMVRALRHRFIRPALVIALLSIAAAFQFVIDGDFISGSALLVAAVTLLVDLPCISWVGLWRGLAAAGSSMAIVSTVARTIALPAAWFLLLAGLFNQSSPGEFVGIYFIVSLLNNLLFRASARTRLCEHFRTLALRPYGGKMPHMESKWSPINWEDELREAEHASGASV